MRGSFEAPITEGRTARSQEIKAEIGIYVFFNSRGHNRILVTDF